MKQQPQNGVDEVSENTDADQRLREAISSLVDGEAEELELRRLLSAENRDVVDHYWQRYNLVSDILSEKESVGQFRHLDISQRIRENIEDQSEAGQYAERWWLKPLAGMAVAATVAGVVVFGVQNVNQQMPGMGDVQPASTVASSRVYPVAGSSLQASAGDGAARSVNYGSDLPVSGSATVAEPVLDDARERQLEKYLLRHTDRAALNNGQGLISYARVASFEAE